MKPSFEVLQKKLDCIYWLLAVFKFLHCISVQYNIQKFDNNTT